MVGCIVMLKGCLCSQQVADGMVDNGGKEMSDVVHCPNGHTRVWAHGTVPSKSGPKKRYVCVTCGTTFYKSAAKPASQKKAHKG